MDFLELYAVVDGNSFVHCISYRSCRAYIKCSTLPLYSAYLGSNRPTAADSFVWGPMLKQKIDDRCSFPTFTLSDNESSLIPRKERIVFTTVFSWLPIPLNEYLVGFPLQYSFDTKHFLYSRQQLLLIKGLFELVLPVYP